MRNFTRFSTVFTACLALGAAACSDDPATGDTTDATTATQGDTTVTQGDTTVSTPNDTTTSPNDATDPCAGVVCDVPPGPECEGNSVVTYAATGTCVPGTGTAHTCDYTETSTACTGTDVCAAGACIAAGDKCDYTFDSKVSYVTSIALGNQTKDSGGAFTDACCFDFTDDGKIDNKLGSLLGSLGDLVDVNGSIVENIESNDLVLLLETKGVDDLQNDTDVDISGFYGKDLDGDVASNTDDIGGESHFAVNPASFVANTMLPLISFPNATITNGTIKAGPSVFNLSVPIAGAELNIAVSQTRLEGHVGLGGNGTGLKIDGGEAQPLGAMLGGIIKMMDLINALNSYVGSCECLTFASTMITVNSSTGKPKCEAAVTDTCTDADGACKQIPGYCSTLLIVLTPDIDLDGDEKASSLADGISVGVWVKANSATIDSVDTCPAE